MKHNNIIALRVGWKICCWYLVVTFLRVRFSLCGQCGLVVVAVAFVR